MEYLSSDVIRNNHVRIDALDNISFESAYSYIYVRNQFWYCIDKNINVKRLVVEQ